MEGRGRGGDEVQGRLGVWKVAAARSAVSPSSSPPSNSPVSVQGRDCRDADTESYLGYYYQKAVIVPPRVRTRWGWSTACNCLMPPERCTLARVQSIDCIPKLLLDELRCGK